MPFTKYLPAFITNSKLYAKAEHHWLTTAFILGFVVDNITLNRVDQVFDNLILLSHLILSTFALLALYAGTADKLGKYGHKAKLYSPLVIQYTFGGLLSGMLIFYGRSGAWVQSWPFLAIILLAIYLNETIKDRSSRLVYNISIFFVGIFSYAVLVIPVLTGKMGPVVFVSSGLLALFFIYAFINVLYRIIPHFLELHMRTLVFAVGCVFFSFNFLYFTNIIPPIPLSLKEVGIYHSVVRDKELGIYKLTYEEGSWWQLRHRSDKVFRPVANGSVSCFARIFAPTRLDTVIEHNFEYYNPTTKKWESVSKTGYEISGGRSDGFRGYTLTNNYKDGKWRCSIETKRGQVLGREVFYINSTEEAGNMVTRLD